MRRRSRTATILRWVVAGYAVIGVLVALALLLFAPSPAPFRASDSPGAAEIFADPAESWSDFNKGVAAQPPVWGADEFLAAVATARGGQVVRMGATATHLDDAAITTVVKGPTCWSWSRRRPRSARWRRPGSATTPFSRPGPRRVICS